MKKTIITYTSIILLFLLIDNISIAQWSQTNGPGGIDIYGMYADGANIWAGTGISIYYTTNQGTIWNRRYNGIPIVSAPYSYSIVRHGSYMLAGILNLGIYRSSDYGLNWSDASSGLSANTTIRALASVGTVAIAGGFSGVYLSTNNGLNWVRPNSGYPATVYALYVMGNNVYAGANTGIYRS